MAKKIPALRTRVNAVKRELRSKEPARMLAGARSLAEHAPEVADALLDGVTTTQKRSGATRFVPNKTFRGKRGDQPWWDTGLLLAVLFAPEESASAALRAGITHLLATHRAVPVDVVVERLPQLEVLKVGTDATGLAALKTSSVTELELDTGYRTPADLELLEGAPLVRLQVRPRGGVRHVEILQTLEALEELVLYDVDGLDLASLPRGLRHLHLHESRNITGIAGLPPQLESLSLTGCDQSLRPLRERPLTRLSVRDPSDLSVLAGHPTLTGLSITGSSSVDLSELTDLPNLQRLTLTRSDALARLDGLTGCPRLVKLYIQAPNLTDIAGLASLPSLEDLEIREARDLTDLRPIQALPNLDRLVVYNCGAKAPEPPSAAHERLTFPMAHVRRQALDELGAQAGPEALQLLQQAMTDPLLAKNAARALATRADGRAALQTAADTGSLDAVWAAAEERTALDLTAALAHPDAQVRAETAACAVRIPGPPDPLLAAITDPEAQVRRWAALAWAHRDGTPAPLQPLLTDTDPLVRRAAVCALGFLGSDLSPQDPDLQPLAAAWAHRWPAPDDLDPIALAPIDEVYRDGSRHPDPEAIPLTAQAAHLKGRAHNLLADHQVFPARPNLLSLEILSRKLTSAAPLTRLQSLQRLALQRNKKLVDLEPLRGLTELRVLDVHSTSVSDLTPLSDLRLIRLWLDHTPVSDLSPLAGLPLRNLGLSSTHIRDLSVLNELPELEALDIGRCRVTDFETLGDLGRLRSLSLKHTDIKEGIPLVRLTGLAHLDLTGTRFSAPDLLLHLPLRELTLPSHLHDEDPIGTRLLKLTVRLPD